MLEQYSNTSIERILKSIIGVNLCQFVFFYYVLKMDLLVDYYNDDVREYDSVPFVHLSFLDISKISNLLREKLFIYYNKYIYNQLIDASKTR